MRKVVMVYCALGSTPSKLARSVRELRPKTRGDLCSAVRRILASMMMMKYLYVLSCKNTIISSQPRKSNSWHN